MARSIRRTVIGGYHVKGVLGEGGMGTVYLARDEAGKEVAIKVIRPAEELDDTYEEELARFKREGKIALELDHPNVVRTLGMGELDDGIFIVSEYVRGGSLENLLARAGRLSPPAALELGRDLFAALQAIEAAGFVHRDVKPANILLELDGRAKLTDLGLARSHHGGTRLTRAGDLLGSPHYMSPEQANGAPDLDSRSDVYSVGVVLFEVLAGTPPFDSTNVYEILKRQKIAPPPELKTLAAHVPDAVASFVMTLLAKDRAARPSLAEAFARATALLAERAAPAEGSTKPEATSFDMVADQSLAALVAGIAGARPRTSIPDEEEEPTTRASLTWSATAGERRLLVFFGTRLVFGRKGGGVDDVDVELALERGGHTEALTPRISRRHFEVSIVAGRPHAMDLGGRGKTRLDGVVLVPNEPRPMPAGCVLDVAGVLKLRARTLAPCLETSTATGRSGQEPALVLEAGCDGGYIAVALIPSRVSLATSTGGSLVWGVPGDTELFQRDGALWLRGGGLAVGASVPLVPSLRFTVEGTDVVVREVATPKKKS